jgi:hypothetical protein
VYLIVACDRPGLIRAGQRHPAFAAYPVEHFSADQRAELMADPSISLALGFPISTSQEPIVYDAARRHAQALDTFQTYLAAGIALPPLPPVDQGAPSVIGETNFVEPSSPVLMGEDVATTAASGVEPVLTEAEAHAALVARNPKTSRRR